MLSAVFKKIPDKEEFNQFVRAQHYWLEDFAIFTVIKSSYGGRSWNEWPNALKNRQPQALKDFCSKNALAIERVKFTQYLFSRQWHKLKSYANSKNISIIGYIHIYVNYEIDEDWKHPSYIKIDGKGQMQINSCVPPDYISRNGQRCGIPVYNWENLK